MSQDEPATGTPPMIDNFGRRITYARLSVTDRCDLRCRYCMSERMTFLPHDRLLSFDEIEVVTDVLIERGVRRLRLTGGEPLVRKGVLQLVDRLGRRIGSGLDELTLTTNGTQLASSAAALFQSGVRRVNVSLDSLDPDNFSRIARRARLSQVVEGIEAARSEGLCVKINMVALAGLNDHEIEPMMRWCAGRGCDLTLIETMPLGEIDDPRLERFLPLTQVISNLEHRYTFRPLDIRSGGPARYFEVPELKLKLGLISPLTNNFCAGCNRIRITAEGRVFGCLGHDIAVELRDIIRRDGRSGISQALDRLISKKPARHDFDITSPQPAVVRHMSVTGG